MFTALEVRMAETKQEQYHNSLLYRIRHSAAHVMAQAVLEMFPDGEDRHRPAHRGWLLL